MRSKIKPSQRLSEAKAYVLTSCLVLNQSAWMLLNIWHHSVKQSLSGLILARLGPLTFSLTILVSAKILHTCNNYWLDMFVDTSKKNVCLAVLSRAKQHVANCLWDTRCQQASCMLQEWPFSTLAHRPASAVSRRSTQVDPQLESQCNLRYLVNYAKQNKGERSTNEVSKTGVVFIFRSNGESVYYSFPFLHSQNKKK